MRHLYFCRHGQSVLNVEGKFAGSIETPLTKEGRGQARHAGIAAKNLGVGYIICSPLSRAHDTARIIAKEIGYPEKEIDVNSLVVERHFGELEGKTWQADMNLDDIVDIEAVDTLLERAKLTLNHLRTIQADTILVVSHGAFGRALRHIVNPDIPFHGSERFENAKLIKLL